MKDRLHIATLIAGKIKGSLSQEELKEFETWLNEDQDHQVFFEKISSNRYQLDKLDIYNQFNKDKSWQQLEEKLFESRIIRMGVPRYLKYAASILVPVLLAAALVWTLRSEDQPTIATIDNVIQPGTEKATLILSDGGTITLDKMNPVDNIQEGDTRITQSDNSLVYEEGQTPDQSKPLVYNELLTPRGGSYQLALADGSRVWMNAGSSLKFPVAFTDTVRQVFLTGEAYFEVNHNGKPFIVTTDQMDVRVLGTSFNVSAYPDDQEGRTTLVEGSVRIETGDEARQDHILIPGQQAVTDEDGLQIVEVNTSRYTSWINGKLEFQNDDLESVMIKLARWYDFDYEFQKEEARDYHFTARVDKTEKLSAILNMLELTTDVRFELVENTVIVL